MEATLSSRHGLAGAMAPGPSWRVRAWLSLVITIALNVLSMAEPEPRLLSIADFENAAGGHGSSGLFFRIEGVVCAVAGEGRFVVLQDTTAAVLLELSAADGRIKKGECVAVEGRDCEVIRSRFGIKLGGKLLIDINGIHGPKTQSAGVLLKAGFQPIHLSWFNRFGSSTLKLDYSGPGVARQRIPDTALWHPVPGTSGFRPGLAFEAFAGNDWSSVADFEGMEPAASGVAHNFDPGHAVREEDAGLIFSGYLKVPETGFYVFHLESDDGSCLRIGSSLEVVPLDRKASPVTMNLEQAMAAHGACQWVEVEGIVTFASRNGARVELEVAGTRERYHVTVIDAKRLETASLVRRNVRVCGVFDAAHPFELRRGLRLMAPGAAEIKLVPAEAVPPSADPILTTAAEVLRLKREEAGAGLPARLRGVLTSVSSTSLVLQDATGGVFIHRSSKAWPSLQGVGEYWEIQGKTDPGDFAPMVVGAQVRFLGYAALPEPIRPEWDQLMNGSLDAQYIELQGVPTSISPDAMHLLTRYGKIKINPWRDFPLPRLSGVSAYLGSLVRIRGCLVPEWDPLTGRIQAGVIKLASPVLHVDEPKPSDPFSLPVRRAAELLLFDKAASALQRTKIAGRIIYARPGEYFILDGEIGLRLLTPHPIALETGHLVEAVGFPQFGGASLVLREADVRITGKADLPAATPIAPQQLLNRNLDSTLIQVEAILLGVTAYQEGCLLELQSAPHHFMARLKCTDAEWKPLRIGSRLRLTGVYSSLTGSKGMGGAFELLLNGASSVTLLQRGPWWTVRRAIAVIVTLVSILGIAVAWITLLRRKVEERTRQLQKEIRQRQIAEQCRAMEQERTRVAQNLHDELGAGLTEVGILGALAKNPSIPSERKERCLNELTEKSRSLVTALDEIVWAINPNYDSVGSLVTYYSLFAQRFLSLAGISCRLQIVETFPDCPLDSSIRHGAFLAFKEALNNVVRHSGATEAALGIEVGEQAVKISLADSGRGFELGKTAPGSDGLANMRRRLAQLGGQFRIQSRVGHGTTVEFHFDLNRTEHDQDRHRGRQQDDA